MFTEAEQEQIDKEVQVDLNFQDRLGDHSKQALIMMLDQLTSADRSQRGWILKHLRGLEDLVSMARLESLQDRVLDAIKNERLARDAQRGPVAMRPMTIAEWTTELSYAVTRANTKAQFGQTAETLKAILTVATVSVEALENCIDMEEASGEDILTAAIKELIEGPADVRRQMADVKRETGDVRSETADPCSSFERENKEADARDGAQAPAKSESLNNQ